MIKKEYNILNVALFSALMMLIIMLPSMIMNRGIFFIRGDYVDQYLLKLIKSREVLISGKGTWDWFNFLGNSYNKLGAFLSLNSISLLFPSKMIPYVVTFLHLPRIAFVAMASFAYFKFMVKEEKTAFLGAILYTFSSYTFVNMEFMQYIDSIWTFPFLLYGVEKMFRSKNYKQELIIAVFLSCIISSYMFVFSAILFSLYFLCRFFLSEEWREKRKVKYFLLAVFEYILGFLCAFFAFASFFYKMFNSSGSATAVGRYTSPRNLVYDWGLVSRFFSLFMPAASNRFSTFGHSAWGSRAAYVPVFGFSFVIAYLSLKGGKKWLKVLCTAGVICFILPIIVRAFNFFSSAYTRYSYGIILFFVLATILFLENYKDKIAKRSVFIAIDCLAVLLIIFFIVKAKLPIETLKQNWQGLTHEQDTEDFFRIFVLIASIVSYATLLAAVYSKKVMKNIIPVVSAFIVVYGCFYTSFNLTGDHLLDYFPKTKVDLKEQINKYYFEIPENDDPVAHRIEGTKQWRNYSYAVKKPAISIFESVRNSYSSKLAKYIGISASNANVFVTSKENSTRTLLGVKYYYDVYPDDKIAVPEGFSKIKTEHGVDVYENDYFIGMGFTYDSYLTFSQFKNVYDKDKNNADILLNTLVVDDKDAPFVSDILKPCKDTDVTYKDRKSLNNFKMTSEGFTAELSSPKEEIVFVSVPYEDNGWTLKINGEEKEFIKANIGCIAFKTESGDNEISLSYSLPYLPLGLIGSFAGFVILAIYLAICKTRKVKLADKQ